MSVKTSLQGKNWSRGDARNQKRITKKILKTFRRKILVPLELVDLYVRGGDLIVTRVEPREGTQKAEKRLFVLKRK